jgi:hypothetical protein
MTPEHNSVLADAMSFIVHKDLLESKKFKCNIIIDQKSNTKYLPLRTEFKNEPTKYSKYAKFLSGKEVK